MNNLTLRQLAVNVLKDARTPMTVEEIWEYAVKSEKFDITKFQGKTPWRTIGAIIYTNIKDAGDKSEFIKIAGRPTRFFLRNENFEVSNNSDMKSIVKKSNNMGERALHKHLTYFVDLQFDAYTKTIDDKKSKKGTKGENEWLHPDIVGIYYPRDDWDTKVLELDGITGNTSVKIFSFELKQELSFINLRTSFFQTVSNSYWANEAYLAAGKVDRSPDFNDELKRLSSLFGIGIIEIDSNEPQNSDILFNATHKPQLDWETINKLCLLNDDFKDFISAVTIILNDKSKSLGRENIMPFFDKIYSLEDFVKA
ncbi:MAG: HrgA protein [Oscillospiraceae bacterium]|jgi:hypothetical protein|nr:HrgA protein [Oscillospiraceae bacterium]